MFRKSDLNRIMALMFLGVVLGGCSHLQFPAVFKIDIAQGTILDPEKVSALRPGMTDRQVVYLLGSPLLQDPLQPNRWDYVYSFQSQGGVAQSYRIALWFDDNVLQKIENDGQPIKDWHRK